MRDEPLLILPPEHDHRLQHRFTIGQGSENAVIGAQASAHALACPAAPAASLEEVLDGNNLYIAYQERRAASVCKGSLIRASS